MATATKNEPATTNGNKAGENLPAIRPPRLPYHPGIQDRFGIDRTDWTAIVEVIFPNATNVNSVLMALAYMRARKLDVMKRPVHIVSVWSTSQNCMVDTIWPGIGELRTTAFRTGEYAGKEETALGPMVEKQVGSKAITFPEWAQVTVYRMVRGVKAAFAGPKVYWLETYATVKRNDDTPNQMWSDRPIGQLDKCAEAAALRTAFPEEIGGDLIPEEVRHDKDLVGKFADPKPAKTLDSLADSMTAPQPAIESQPQEPNQEAPSEPPADAGQSSELDHYRELIATLDTQKKCDELCTNFKKSNPEDMHQDAEEIRDARKKEIHENRGAGSNKQKETLT